MLASDRSPLTPNHSDADEPAPVRSAIDRLRQLDTDTARYLDALAFVLMRVAEADSRVTDSEVEAMEQALSSDGLPEDQAMLVVEIARHRLRHADAGSSYSVSRHLRHRLAVDERLRLLPKLDAVATADGHRCDFESATIEQIAWELGFERGATEGF